MFWMLGVKVMGLGNLARKSGPSLLGWIVGCSYGHFENSPRVNL